MTAPEDIRASDADRQRVADALSRCASEGRITLDELTDRLDEAYTARTLGQLGANDGPLREMPPLSPPLLSPGPPSVWADHSRLTSAPAPVPRPPSRRGPPVVPWLLIVAVVAVALTSLHWAGDKSLWLLVVIAFLARRAFWPRGGHHPHR